MTPHVLDALAHPVVGTLLLTLGALGLLSEAREPGLSLPGAAGVLALGALLAPALALDPRGWPGLLLLLGASPLVTWSVRRQAAVPATAAVLAAGAGVAWVLVGGDATRLRVAAAASMVGSSLLLVLLAAWALWWRMPAARRPDRLGWAVAGPVGEEPDEPVEGASFTGEVGTAASALRPDGEAVFGAARVAAVSDSGWIAEGTLVRAVARRGSSVVVEPVEPADPAPPG